MHRSSYVRMEYLLNHYKPLWQGCSDGLIHVLDIGSYDQNGTYKDLHREENIVYTGLDMSKGPNVDIVPKDIYSWDEIADESFDLVISGQVFEHIEYPWLTVKEIERIMKPSGVFIMIAPNAGIEHKAPLDCYRYFSQGLEALAKWAGLKVLHAGVAGVPSMEGTDDWVSEWNDATLAAQKLPASKTELDEPFRYERRRMLDGSVSDTYKDWHVAVCENKKKFHNDKQYILFGAGVFGGEILDVIGADNVYCFADNSVDKQGKEMYGKRVISYEAFKQISKDYNCLVTAPRRASFEIKQQLQRDDICCGTLFP